MVSKNISQIFVQASTYLKETDAENAWNRSVENANINLNREDKENIKVLGKMLGKTDKEGQVSQLELTKTFIEMQIEKAKLVEGLLFKKGKKNYLLIKSK